MGTKVLRYAYGGSPLWCTLPQPPMLPESDMVCCHCGSSRIFECQLMPGLLSYLPKKTHDDKTIEETSSPSCNSQSHRIDTAHTISVPLSNTVDDNLESSEIARPTLEQLKNLMM